MIRDVSGVPDDARFNISEAAEVLGISRPTLYDRIRRGFITPRRRRDCRSSFLTGRDLKAFVRRIGL